ncbi:MAG: ribosomal RNA small subunit methyltransferase A [Proteobacteria bacterium]|nr:ribosomal RNA small subunit methyltransferase A [Pseudomonadota bacterium]
MGSVRQMLAQYGIHPRKKLGQSFLTDMNITRRIASLAEPAENETIVEIGAGLGFLTEELARKAGRVIALEIDPRLIEALKDRFTGNASVEIVEMDVLEYHFSAPSPGGKLKVVGNVPYHISTPILFRLLEYRRSISSMVLMFQKELADRLAAPPGTKEYGIPSVMIARYASVTRELAVPASCFYPEPSVASAVLRIVFADDPEPQEEGDLFAWTVRKAFAQRRKTLLNNLHAAGFEGETLAQVFRRVGIEGGRRAETLSVKEFLLLAAGLAADDDAERISRRAEGPSWNAQKILDRGGRI